MANEIQRIEPPVLPLPRSVYDRKTSAQHNNILRLYFNRVTSLLGFLLSPDAGGKFLYMPHARFYDTTTQNAVATATAYVITYNTLGEANNISLVSNSQITVVASGVYLFNIYAHVDTSGAAGDITLWARVNGTNVDGSSRRVNAAADSPLQFSGALVLSTADYVEFYWETDNTNVELATVAAGTNYPAIPSVSVSVSYVGNG